MKRLFFILSLLFAMQISAQTEIIIGDTASNQSSSKLPISISYRYSFRNLYISKVNWWRGRFQA
ncbi:MAG: hypothetical protein J6Q96_07830 [Bacteroidales bacterium]|nr:hypothetical protein [Bacteroidales bacterium]